MSKSGLKMLDVLQVVGVSTVPLGLLEIANELGLDKTTASRMLASLMKRDFITRDTDSKKYRIGPGFLGLSSAVTSRAEILRLTQPYMLQLRERTAETVSLHVRANTERICIGSIERFPPNIEKRRLGVRYPLYNGTAGKVIMAFLPQGEQDALRQAAVAEGRDPERLSQQLSAVREQGYLQDVAELKTYLGAVSAPLFETNKVFGSLAVTGPLERMHEAYRLEIAPIVREMAVAISDVTSASRVYSFQGDA